MKTNQTHKPKYPFWLAAVILSLHNFEIVFLGPNTPLVDIASAASNTGTVGVVIGLAASSDLEQAAAQLTELRAMVSAKVIVVVGGNKSRLDISGVSEIESFEEFSQWTNVLASGMPGGV